MTRQKLLAIFAGISLIITLASFSPDGLYASAALTQAKGKQAKDKKEQTKKKKDAAAGRPARPVMWQDPVDIERRDLFYGPGGREGAPEEIGPYTYLRHSKGGTQKKIIVKDDRGREWTVKFGPEARPETAASRIVWAVGYHVDQDYFVKRARIEGEQVYDARDVRFERRDDGFKEEGNWSWDKNPFVGTRELDGMKVLMALLKNWDLKSDNNKTVRLKGKGENDTLIYYVSDLGATLGRTGSFLNKIPFFGDLPADETFFGAKKSKGDPKAFAKEKFLSGEHKEDVKLHSERTRCKHIFKDVKIEHARWIGRLLGRLSDKQLNDAFRAGGFNDEEVAIYRRTMRQRIRELQNVR